MIEFNKLIITGKSLEINSNITSEEIIRSFGEPDIFTPAHKSYPMILVYKDLEFRLRNNLLKNITFTLDGKDLELPNRFVSTRINRSFYDIQKELNKHQIKWQKDTIMSDDTQKVYITENNVHFSFFENTLMKIGIVYI